MRLTSILLVLLAVLALPACSGDDGGSDDPLRDAAEFASGGGPAPEMKVFDAPQDASAIAYGDGHLWIANDLSGTIQRVENTETGALSAPIQVEAEGQLISKLAVGHGRIWVAGDDRVVIVESGGAVSGEAKLAHAPNGIAVSPEGVWAAGGGQATRIDPVTGEAAELVQLPGFSEDIAIAAGTLYTPSGEENGQVGRFKADTGEGAGHGPLTIGVQPDAIGAAGDRVYIGDEKQNAVYTVDAETGAPVGRPIPVGGLPSDVEASDKGVFVLTENIVKKLDPVAGQVEWKVQLDRSVNDMTVTDDAVWLAGGTSLIKLPL